MKKWDNIGKLKAAVLVLCALPNLFMPFEIKSPLPFLALLAPLLFGIIAIPLITKPAPGREIIKPTWNDPLRLKTPLALFHFGAYFFLIIGLSVLISSGIRFKTLNFVGLAAISYGVGILIGIHLTLFHKK